MRKKFTMLFAALFLMMGTAWAQTNSYTRIEGFEAARTNSTVYALKATRSPLYFSTGHNELAGYWTQDGALKGDLADATSAEQQFAFLRTEKTEAGKYYMYSVAGECFITAKGAKADTPEPLVWLVDVTDKADASHQGMKLYIGTTGDNVVNMTWWSNNTAGGVRYNTNNEADAGNVFELIAYDQTVDLAAAVAAINAVEGDEVADIYAVHANAQGTRNSSDRRVQTISLASNLSASNAANATTLTHDGNGLKYIDMTETVTMKAYANEPVTAAVSLYSGHWIHAYTYIDLNNDGFTAGVDADGYTPTGDLMTYSFYSANADDRNTWYNKDGQVANNNTLVMPQFMAPAAPGTYRMRFKTDWNDLQPDGSGAQFVSANGTIVDVTLVVEEAPTNYTVKYDFVYKGEVKYSQENLMQLVGAEYPAITVTHPYGVVSAAKPTGVVDGSDAVGGVITKQIELTVQGLPFEFSDSYANAVWYYMPLHASGKYYLGYAAGQTSITLSDAQKVLPAEGHDAYLWAFVGDPFTGFKIMNKAAGDGKILSSSETMSANSGETTYPLMVDGTSVPAGNNTYWIPSVSNHATNGFYLEQKGKSSNKMNRRGDNLAYWSGGADGGSTFRVTTIATEGDVAEAQLLTLFAGKVGYPQKGIAVENELLDLTVGRATKLDVAIAVSNYKKSTNIVLPEDGKAYKIYNYSHYDANSDGVGTTRYLNYTEGQALSVNEDANEASVFVCKKLSDGTYTFVTEDGKVLTWMNSGEGYKENDKFNGYSSNYAIEYSNYSDWNRITVKKNGNTEDDFGHLRLVARRYARDNEAYSSFIIKGNDGTWDKAGDSYFLQKPEVDSRCFSSAWILSEVEHTNTDAENLAVAKIAALGVRYGLLAEGIGGYHYMLNGAENYSWATVRDAVHAMTSVDEVNNVAFGINQPAAGFYRIKSMNGNNADKKGKYWQVNSDASAMELNATADDFNSIIYLADNTFLSYGAGLYLNNYYNPAAVGTEAKAWSFVENAHIAGTYALYQRKDDGTLDDHCLSDWYGDNPTYGQNDANAAWIFEEVTSLPVAVSAVGYATYYTPVDVVIPEGMTASIVSEIKDNEVLLETVEGVVPAGTGLILNATTGNYEFEIATEKASAEFNQGLLVGTTTKAWIDPEENVVNYVLSNNNNKIGLYKKTVTNAEGKIEFAANKAYLPVEKETVAGAPAMFAFTRGGDDDTTGIESVEASEELVIFDLAGRRVEKMEKGIYIVNGKKVIK